jgi:hypothetical protein
MNRYCLDVKMEQHRAAAEQVAENALMVSAAGFEPATHALKGRCSTN